MRPAILCLDTNILLDCPRGEDYRLPTRRVTVVVIPEVMRELRGLSRSRERGLTGPALLALATLEPLMRRIGAGEVRLGRSGTNFRLIPGPANDAISTDRQLILRAKAEQARKPVGMVIVVTKDWGVAELARGEGVRSILIRGTANAAELERGIAAHDSALDIDV